MSVIDTVKMKEQYADEIVSERISEIKVLSQIAKIAKNPKLHIVAS